MQLPNHQPIQPLPLQGMQQPVMFYQAPVPNNNGGHLENYQAKQSKFLGAFQILIGILCIVFNIISIGISAEITILYGVTFTSYGIWTGALFITSGALGVEAGRKRTKCSIVAFMVLCIISASVATLLLTFGIVGALVTGSQSPSRISCSYRYGGYDDHLQPCIGYKVVLAMEILMAIMAVFGGILTIWGSALCCRAVCCCSSAGRTDRVMLIPQYCCSDQQTTSVNPAQAPFEQVPYYVWPTQGSGANGQFVIGQPMPISADASAGVPWNPPSYTSQTPPSVFPLPEEKKHGALC